jgi:NTE family protein
MMDISIALGGGGAKGNAHVGVLRALERKGFRIRALAGTSFGGIVAILYALGLRPDEIESAFKKVDQARLYGRLRDDGPSLLGVAGIQKWLDEIVGQRTFDDLRLPCAVCAVDLRSGREIILSEGRLRDAIMATIALPGIFPSYRLNDWELVDGGVLDPVPVSVARTLAPSLPVIAVVLNLLPGEPVRPPFVALPSVLPNSIAARLTRLRIAQAFNIYVQSVDIGSRMMADLRLKADKPDLIIRPAVGQIEILDRVDVSEVALRGEQAVEASLPELRRLAGWPNRLRRRFLAERPA